MASARLALRDAAARWARRRQGEDLLPTRLVARRIYIVPTRAGLSFVVILFGVLLGGLNFGNSVALMLCFVLGSMTIVAMVQCHRRLLDLEVVSIEPQPAFAGDPVRVRVRVRQPDSDLRDLRVASGAAWTHFDAGGDAMISAPPAERGPWRPKVVRLEQRAPFGLFRAWALIHPAITGWIWPRAEGQRPPPAGANGARGRVARHAGLDEWAGLRPFREGDSPRRVAWKAYARGAPLLVREYQDPEGSDHRFDFGDLDGLDAERRFSQLARWIIDAEQRGERWSLRVPGFDLSAESGAAHRQASLDALARSGFDAP